MSIASQANGYPFHIHIEGVRGTGKTTILRAAKQILPPMVRIKNCIYNCDPEAPHCPMHRGLSPIDIQKIGTEVVPRPFLEISHSAKIGTVVGSIDLEKLTDTKQQTAALLPGTIPKAHRGIIFVDEINRLADTSPELADILLDIMGTKPGRVQIEETGLPTIELPISVSIWAASNPDEDPGPLQQIRKQLSDRFDLNIQMARPKEHQTVCDMLAEQNGVTISDQLVEKLTVGPLQTISMSQEITSILASIYIEFSLESLRAIEALQMASKLIALQSGRKKVTAADISEAVPLVLRHRVDEATLAEILVYLGNIYKKKEQNGNLVQPKSLQGAFVHQTGTNSWLKNLWTSLCQRISAYKHSVHAAALENRGGGNVQTSSSVSSPQKDVVAPPKPALPLDKLPHEKLLTVETKEHYDRENKAIL